MSQKGQQQQIKIKEWYNNIAYNSIEEFKDKSLFMDQKKMSIFQNTSHSYHQRQYPNVYKFTKDQSENWQSLSKIEADNLLIYDSSKEVKWSAKINWRCLFYRSQKMRHQYYFQFSNYFESFMYRYTGSQKYWETQNFNLYLQIQRQRLKNNFFFDIGASKKFGEFSIFGNMRLSQPRGYLLQRKFGVKLPLCKHLIFDYIYHDTSSLTENKNKRHQYKVQLNFQNFYANILYKIKDQMPRLKKKCSSHGIKTSFIGVKKNFLKGGIEIILNAHETPIDIIDKIKGRKIKDSENDYVLVSLQSDIASKIEQYWPDISDFKVLSKFGIEGYKNDGYKYFLGMISATYKKVNLLIGLIQQHDNKKTIVGFTINQ